MNSALDRNMYVFKVTVCIKLAEYEYSAVPYSSLRVFNM